VPSFFCVHLKDTPESVSVGNINSDWESIMNSAFVHSPDYYQRDLDILKHDCEQQAFLLEKMTGKPYALCLTYLTSTVYPQLKNPRIRTLYRENLEDRHQYDQTMQSYLKEIQNERHILTPTLTLYLNPEKKRSYLSEFIEENIARRAQAKKEMFNAKTPTLRSIKANEQLSFKLFNNSLSGAQSSSSTCLYNKTAHPSMTTVCRIATSYANANNEKLLQGNRHYFTAELTRSNILAITQNANYNAIEAAINQYQLVYPTVDQTMAVIERSTSLYWINPQKLQQLRELIERLSPLERAAFVYEGDFYHLAQYNDSMMRSFLDRMTTKATQPLDHPETFLKTIDSDLEMYVCLLCADDLKCLPLHEAKTANPNAYGVVAATAKAVLEVIDSYRLFIEAFVRVESVIASVSDVPNMLRRAVVTSDTDSTIFSTEYWVEWFCGTVCFTPKACAIAYLMTYFVTQSIAHILAFVSSILGVETKHLHRLAMKNEYSFPVFVRTPMTKNYYAYVSSQEGTVYPTYDLEIKGKHLKETNAPKEVMDVFVNMLRTTMDEVIAGRSIKIQTYIDQITEIERTIIDSIYRGEITYLSRAKVDSSDSYKREEVSPYLNYLLWCEVFLPKYGYEPQLPYEAIKVSLDLDKPLKLTQWLAALEDRPLAQRMSTWLRTHKKTTLSNVLIPRQAAAHEGVPKEFIQALDTRKIVYQTTKPFYVLLETLGVYLPNKHLTRLISTITRV
jgi:hypothetical protein